MPNIRTIVRISLKWKLQSTNPYIKRRAVKLSIDWCMGLPTEYFTAKSSEPLKISSCKYVSTRHSPSKGYYIESSLIQSNNRQTSERMNSCNVEWSTPRWLLLLDGCMQINEYPLSICRPTWYKRGPIATLPSCLALSSPDLFRLLARHFAHHLAHPAEQRWV